MCVTLPQKKAYIYLCPVAVSITDDYVDPLRYFKITYILNLGEFVKTLKVFREASSGQSWLRAVIAAQNCIPFMFRIWVYVCMCDCNRCVFQLW